MKKKKFSSIAVAILFVLQMFSSFGPIGNVKAGGAPNSAVYVNSQFDGSKAEDKNSVLTDVEKSFQTKSDKYTAAKSGAASQVAAAKSIDRTASTVKKAVQAPVSSTQTVNSNSSTQTQTAASSSGTETPAAASSTKATTPAGSGTENTAGTNSDTQAASAGSDAGTLAEVKSDTQTSVPAGSASTETGVQTQVPAEDSDAGTAASAGSGTETAAGTSEGTQETSTGSSTVSGAGTGSGNTQQQDVPTTTTTDTTPQQGETTSETGTNTETTTETGANTGTAAGTGVNPDQSEQTTQQGETSNSADGGAVPGEVQPTEAEAEGSDITDTFPFITGFSGLTDKDGKPLGDNVDKASEIHANYTWSIPNKVEVKSGDYYKMQLPAQIHIAAPIDQAINDDDGTKVADMQVGTNGLVTLTFTDYPDTHSNVSGYFYIDCHFEESEIGNNNPVTITFNIPGISDPVTVDVDFDQPQPSITKDVVDKGYDPATDEITWKITVNKENVNVNNASVEDTINAEQVFVPGSVTVNGDSVAYNYDDTDRKLTVDLGDITTQQVITFKTSIRDDLAAKGKGQGSYDYSNKAILNYEEDGTPQTITSNTKTVNVPVELISKDGQYDEANKKIDWTITVNESGRTIDNAVVTDTIPEGLTLIDGSVKVDGVAGSSYTMSGQTFIYTLGNITEKKVITFSTSVDTDVYNSNNYLNYNNTAVLTGDGVADGTSDSVGVGVSSNIIQKTGSGYDAATGIITWTITVNGNKTNVAAGAVVTDTIPAGQQYVAGSANLDGSPIGDSGYTAADPGDEEKTGTFVYAFSSAFSDTHTITFQTRVTDSAHYKANYSGEYYNYVNLTGVGINQDTTGTQWVDSNVITKTGEGYDYSTREITWEIVVNRNAMPITNAVVTDVIPEGQEYVAGSAKLNDSTIDDSAVNNPLTTRLFKYSFAGTINSTYTITFRTEITDLSIFNTSGDKTLENTASITGNEIPAGGDATSTGTQTVRNSVVTKESDYTYGKSYIDWTVKANANWSIPLAGTDITSATITDTLQDGLSLDTDTVELYKATVNADGSLTPGDKVALTADNVKYNPETREFDFTFPQSAGTGAFILKFRTNVTKTGNYTNSVEFVGSGVEQDSNTTKTSVWFSQGGGGATGETGSITVVKVDSSDESKKLPGAVFQLLDQYGNVKETKTTGDDGTALFEGLKYDLDYSVKEITPPTGYNLSPEVYEFQIHNADGQKNITYNYVDEILKGRIQFYKTGIDGPLQGAEFTLYKDTDTIFSNPIAAAVSNETGLVQFNDIPYGKYIIKETAAPSGYSISDKVLNADLTVITADDQTVNADAFIFPDSKLTGSIKITKIDASTGEAIQGVTIAIFDNNKEQTGNPKTTGEDGTVQFDNLVYGNYFYKEISAPDNYVLDSTYHPFSIETESTPGEPQEVTFENQEIKGGIEITKTDASTSEPVPGATITVYKSDGTPVGSGVEGTTGEDGTVEFDNLTYGDYYFLETNAPEGYLLNGDKHPFSITEDGVILTDSLTDTKIRGNIVFTKTDQSGNPLSGVEFKLYKADDTAFADPVKTAVSGGDGKVQFTDVEYGEYIIKETAASDDSYVISTKTLSAVIGDNDNGETITLGDPYVNVKKKGTVIIKKIDADGNPLSGAVFTLYDTEGNKAGEAASTDDGTAVFTDVVYGQYIVKETKAPTGYISSDKAISVNITEDGKTYDLGNIENTRITGGIEITKTDASTSEPVPGATITVYKSDGTPVGSGVEGTTGEDGKVVFENLDYGDYYFVETNAPEGYVLNPDEHPFSIKENGVTLKDTLPDTKITGNIQFKKINQSGNPLKGAVFTLYRIGDDGKTLTAVKDADGKDLTAASGADDAEGAAVTTGNVIFKNIEYGSYVIKETAAPSGYYLSSEVLDASITTDGSTVYARPEGDTGTGVYSLSDTKIPGGGSVGIQGTISVKKTDDGGNALSGAVFTLYNSSGNPVQTATTDASGTAQFTKVKPGKYTVKETTAPAGYVLSSQVIPVEVNMSKVYDIGTVKDTKNAASIEVKKTDASGNPLSGAKFTLYNSGLETASAVSGQDGIARFDNVVYGSYTIKETEAPAGYDLNGKTLSVNVDSSKTYQFTVVDEKETPNPNNPGGTPNPNNPGGTPTPNNPGGTPNPNNPGGTPNPNNPGGTPNPNNPGGTPWVNSSEVLPKTGSMVDTAVLLVIGIMAVLAGILILMGSRRSRRTTK